jgi:para-aminobenzoate synthetase component 1
MSRQPIIEEVKLDLSAAQVFGLLRHERPAFFLDSGLDLANLGRYSFIGVEPFLVLKSRGNVITIDDRQGHEIRQGSPFRVLRELLETYALEPSSYPTPLTGGAVGYFSYDLCHFIEQLPSQAVDDLRLPECCLALYDLVLTFDHLENRAYLASSGFPEQDEDKRSRRAAAQIQEFQENLRGLQSASSLPDSSSVIPAKAAIQPMPHTPLLLRSNFTKQDYLNSIETAREYIAAGDIFQVNLSQRFETDLSVPPYELYRRLRAINPAPFAAYLNFDEVTVVSASPERFLKVSADHVETRPMKGTRPRGGSPIEDERLARELQASIKDRAENVMIVDLERNDLGRVCRFGSVKVRELWTLEKYATVWQLTSNVEGRLQEGKDRIHLLESCFPGGSITGAPKVRSMEIIDELEPTRRSVYTGSLGYLSFSGEMDLNIVIRTILAKGDKAYLQVGGAITYDSSPRSEYEETMHKARALFQALGLSAEVVAGT